MPTAADNRRRLARTASLFVVAAASVVWLSIQPAAAQLPAESKAAAAPAKAPSSAVIPWKRVTKADKKVLAPLEAEWSKLPGHQQRKLIGAARHYPTLDTVEQERFNERLRGWSALTPEQRSDARDQYEKLINLPPVKQEELKARWQHEKQPEKGTAPAPAAPAK